MFNEVEGTLQRAISGEIDSSSLQQAAQEHVQSADAQTVQNSMQTAANNASQSGRQDLAQQISSMLQQHGSNPNALKQDLVTLVKDNPQILQHFEPEIAKSILGRL